MGLYVSWSVFKNFATTRSCPMQYVDLETQYWLKCFDGPFEVETQLPHTETPAEGSDEKDFVDNYKSSANTSFSDGSGRTLSRFAITKSGWGIQCHAVNFELSKLNSIHEQDRNGDDHGFASMKFYNASDEELTTQGDIDTYCVRTDIYIEPDYDIEMIGGEFWPKLAYSEEVYLHFFHVLSGHEFCSDFEASSVAAGGLKRMDGRAPKLLPYVSGQHYTQVCLRARHSAGFQHKSQVVIEWYEE